MAFVVVGSTLLSSLVMLHVFSSNVIDDAPVSCGVLCRFVVGVSLSSVRVRVLVVAVVVAVVVVAVVIIAVIVVAVVVVAVIFVVVVSIFVLSVLVLSVLVLSAFVLSVLAVVESSRSMILSGGL